MLIESNVYKAYTGRVHNEDYVNLLFKHLQMDVHISGTQTYLPQYLSKLVVL